MPTCLLIRPIYIFVCVQHARKPLDATELAWTKKLRQHLWFSRFWESKVYREKASSFNIMMIGSTRPDHEWIEKWKTYIAVPVQQIIDHTSRNSGSTTRNMSFNLSEYVQIMQSSLASLHYRIHPSHPPTPLR